MRIVFALLLCVTGIFSPVALADKAAGQSTYASRGCIGCHGASGISTNSAYPSLKGKSEEYIRKNLSDYRNGARKNAVMNAMAAGLSDRDIYNLGSYIGSLK